MNKGLPLVTGIKWLRQSWKIITKAPLTIIGIVASYLLLVFLFGLPSTVPGLGFIGIILSSIVTSFGTVAIAGCGRDISEGLHPMIYACWYEGWKNAQVRKQLILLGLVYGLCMVAIGFIFGLLSADDVARWTTGTGPEQKIDPALVMQNIPWAAFIFGFFAYGAILCITCFSPLLIAWKGQTLGKAFFFSLFVCLRNIGAMVVLAIVLLSITICGSIGLTSVGGNIGSVFIVFWGMLMTCWSYSCLWPMWVSIFGTEDSTVPVHNTLIGR
ncbi:MAG: hypothetical protein LUC43_01830 [Burkholderiales bacterium]|nr:hypothetical protein [Burkholderiales bacterium]